MIRVTSHLSGLKAFSQAPDLVRSVWRELQSSWFEIVRYIMVSSAKSLMLLLIVSGISLIYIRKRQGPRTEPCRTPDRTGHESECSPSMTTLWVRFGRTDWIQIRPGVDAESMELQQEPLMTNLIKSLAEVHKYHIGLSFVV